MEGIDKEEAQRVEGAVPRPLAVVRAGGGTGSGQKHLSAVPVSPGLATRQTARTFNPQKNPELTSAQRPNMPIHCVSLRTPNSRSPERATGRGV